MHSKDKLANALIEAGLNEMAGKAARGYYHDYLSPLATPCIQLAADLAKVGTPAALALRKHHLGGEFDATREEADEWMKSEDGVEVMSHLSPEMRKIFGADK